MRSTVLLCLALSTASLAAACVVEDADADDAAGAPFPNTARDGGGDARDDEEPSRADAAPEEDAETPEDEDAGRADAAPTDAGRDAAPVDAGPAPFTKAQVQGLFDAKCTGCHAAGGGAGGLSLEPDFVAATLGKPSAQAPGQTMLKAKDGKNSYLVHKLKGTQASVGGAGQRMPRGGAPLTAAEIAGIEAFIDALP